jgi:hypothetical protein
VLVILLEGLGDDGAGVAAAQSGTMAHPIAKSNVAAAVRRRIRVNEEGEFCISGEVVAPAGGAEWRQH